MPEHTSFLTYLIYQIPGGAELAQKLGLGVLAHTPPSWHSLDPIVTSALLIAILLGLALYGRKKFANLDESVVPEDKLTLRTFLEVFLVYFYELSKGVMGPVRAKRYFPIVAAAAGFVFFSNVIGLIPGLAIPPTSNLNITFGTALLVYLLFNYYGIKANGLGYFKHMAGPWLGPAGLPLNILIFIIEVISGFVRPITLSVRLMLNIAVDHLLGGIMLGLFALLVPVPVMFLGVIVIFVQTLVFSLLTAVYIGLATEHEEHGEAAHA